MSSITNHINSPYSLFLCYSFFLQYKQPGANSLPSKSQEELRLFDVRTTEDQQQQTNATIPTTPTTNASTRSIYCSPERHVLASNVSRLRVQVAMQDYLLNVLEEKITNAFILKHPKLSEQVQILRDNEETVSNQEFQDILLELVRQKQ